MDSNGNREFGNNNKNVPSEEKTNPLITSPVNTVGNLLMDPKVLNVIGGLAAIAVVWYASKTTATYVGNNPLTSAAAFASMAPGLVSMAPGLIQQFMPLIKGGKNEKKTDLGARVNVITTSAGVEMKNPCWKGYEPIGLKTKRGKKVPNCVPIKVSSTSIKKMPKFAKGSQETKDHIAKIRGMRGGNIKFPIMSLIESTKPVYKSAVMPAMNPANRQKTKKHSKTKKQKKRNLMKR